MSRDKLGRAVHHQVGAQDERLLQARGHHGAVDLHEGVLGVRHPADVRDVDDSLHGVRGALDHDEARVVRDDGGEVGRPGRARHVHVANLHVVARGYLIHLIQYTAEAFVARCMYREGGGGDTSSGEDLYYPFK